MTLFSFRFDGTGLFECNAFALFDPFEAPSLALVVLFGAIVLPYLSLFAFVDAVRDFTWRGKQKVQQKSKQMGMCEDEMIFCPWLLSDLDQFEKRQKTAANGNFTRMLPDQRTTGNK